jgi:hypothetical protein
VVESFTNTTPLPGGLLASEVGESGQRASPPLGVVKNRQHLAGVVTIALQAAMAEIQSGLVGHLFDERQLDLCFELRIESPVGPICQSNTTFRGGSQAAIRPH